MSVYNDPFYLPKYCGISTFMRLPHTQDLSGVDYAVVGVPLDFESTYHAGQRFGPRAMREASRHLRRYNPVLKVDVRGELSGVDYGDVPVAPGPVLRAYDLIEETLRPMYQAGIVPVLLGGDHGITHPELRAAAARYGKVAVVHFDSHVDTWEEFYGEKYNHGTWARRGVEEGIIDVNRSLQVGIRGTKFNVDDYDVKSTRELGWMVVEAEDVFEMGIPRLIEVIRERVGIGPALLTFDTDFPDAAFVPGTHSPEVAGFTSRETLQILRGLAGIDFVSFDIVCLVPHLDHGETTAWLSVNVVFEFLSLLGYRKKLGGKA